MRHRDARTGARRLGPNDDVQRQCDLRNPTEPIHERIPHKRTASSVRSRPAPMPEASSACLIRARICNIALPR